MRLREVEKGDGLAYRILIRFISVVSGMRLPDAARIVMYHRDFYGKPMTTWTHAAMRGESSWSVGERELMAAMVAKWTSCPFCVDAHGSIARLELGQPLVQSTLSNFEQADISVELKTVLTFLKKLVQSPDDILIRDVQIVFGNKVTRETLEDAIAVSALFSITVRCANAFDFTMLNSKESIVAAKRMLQKGYVSGKVKLQGHPDHRTLAEGLQRRIFQGEGKTNATLRQAIAQRIEDGASLEVPYDELAIKIGEGAYRVTDELIDNVVRKSGSEKAAFELIVTATVSAGLYRWDKGMKVLKAE